MKLKQKIRGLIERERSQQNTDRQNRANNVALAFFYDDNNDNNQNIRQWLWGDNPQDDSNGLLGKIDWPDPKIPQRLQNYTTNSNNSLVAKDQALLQALHSLPLSSDDTKQKLIGILVRTSPSRDNYINPKHNTGLASIFDQHVKDQSENFQKRFFNSIKANELVSDTDFRKVIHRLYFKYLLKKSYKTSYKNKAELANFLFVITDNDDHGISNHENSPQEQRRDNWLATYEELKNARPSQNTGGAAASSTEPSQSELQSTPLLQDFVAESVKYADQRQVNNFDAIQRIYSLLAACPTDQRQKLHRFNKILKNQQQSINIRKTLFARDSDQFLYPALIDAWDKVDKNETEQQKFAANLANVLRELNEDQLKQLNSICQENEAPSADIINYIGQTNDKQSNLNKLKTIEQRRPRYLTLFYSATQNRFVFTRNHINRLLHKLHQLANKPDRPSWMPSSINAFNQFYNDDLSQQDNDFSKYSRSLIGISIMVSYDDFANNPHDTVKEWQQRFNTISQLIQDSSLPEQLHGLDDETLRQEARLIARMQGEDRFQKMTQVYQKLNQIDGDERKKAAYHLNYSLLVAFRSQTTSNTNLDEIGKLRNHLFELNNQNQLQYDAIIDLHNKSRADGSSYHAQNHLDELIVNQRNNLDNLDKINQIARVLLRLHLEDQTALETKIQQLETDKLDTQLNDYCLDYILSEQANKDAIKNWLKGDQSPLGDAKQVFYQSLQQIITQPNEANQQNIEQQANMLDKLYQISDQDSINQPIQTILSHFNLLSTEQTNLDLNDTASTYRLAIQLQLKKRGIQPSTITDALNQFNEQELSNIHKQLQQTTTTNWNQVKQSLNDTANPNPFLTRLYLHLLSASHDEISLEDCNHYFNFFKNCVPINENNELVLPNVDTLKAIHDHLFSTTRQPPTNNHTHLFKTISQYLFLPEEKRPDNFKSEQNIIANLATLNQQNVASIFWDLQQNTPEGTILSQANIDFIQDLSQNSQNHTDDKQNVCRLYSNLARIYDTEIRQQAFQFNYESRQQLPAEKRLAIFSVHNQQLQYPAITQRYKQLESINHNAQKQLMDALNQNDLTSDYLSQMNTICQLRFNIQANEQSQNRDQDSELESFVQLENEEPFNKDTLVNLYLGYLLIQTGHQNRFDNFKNWLSRILSTPQDKDNFAKQLSYLLTPDIDQQHHKKVYGLLNALYKLRQNQNQNQYLNDSTIRTLLTQVPFHSDDQQTGLADIIRNNLFIDRTGVTSSPKYEELAPFLNKVATRYNHCKNLDQIGWEYRIDRLLPEQERSQDKTKNAAKALLNDTQLQQTFDEFYRELTSDINSQTQPSLTKALASILAHETQITDRHTRLQSFKDIFDITKQQPDEQQQAIYDELPNHLSNLEQAKLEPTNNGLNFHTNHLKLRYFPAPPKGLAADTWIHSFGQFANTLNQALQAIDTNRVNKKQKRSLDNFIQKFPVNGPRTQTSNQTLLYYSMVARSPKGYDNRSWQQVIAQWQKNLEQFDSLPNNIEPIIFDVLATRDQNIEDLAQFYNKLSEPQQLFNQALQQNDVNFTARQTIINRPNLADLYQLANTDGAKIAIINLFNQVNQNESQLNKLNQIARVLTRLHPTNTEDNKTALENKIKELETNNLDTKLNDYCLDYVQQQCHENYRDLIKNLRDDNTISPNNWQNIYSALQYVAGPNRPDQEQINQHAAFLAALHERKETIQPPPPSGMMPAGGDSDALHNLLELFATDHQDEWLKVHKKLYDQKTSQQSDARQHTAPAAAAGGATVSNHNHSNTTQDRPTHVELLLDLANEEDKKSVTQFYKSLAHNGKQYQQLYAELIKRGFSFQAINESTLGKVFDQKLIDDDHLQQLNDKLLQPTINQGNVSNYIYLAAILSQANFEDGNRPPLVSFDNLLNNFGHTEPFSKLLTNILNSDNNTLEQYGAFLEAIYTHHQVLNNTQVHQLIGLFNQTSNIQWLQPINDLNTDNKSVALQDYLQELGNASQQAIANTYQLYSHLSQTDNHSAIDVNHSLRKPKAGRKKKNSKFNSQLRLRFLQNDPLVNFYHNKLHNNPTIKEKFHGVLQTLEFNNYFEDFSELINDERLYNHHYTQLINDMAANTAQPNRVLDFYKNLTDLTDATVKEKAFKLNQVLKANHVDFNKRQTLLKIDTQNKPAYPAIIKLNSDNHANIIPTLKSSTEQQFSIINDICQICFNNSLRFPQSTELRYRSGDQQYQLDDSQLIKARRQLAIHALFNENTNLSNWLLNQLDNEQYNNIDHQVLNLAKTPENPNIAIPFIDFIEDLHQQSSSLNDDQLTKALQHLNQACSSNDKLQAFLDLVNDTLNNDEQKVNFLKDLATIHPGNENGIQQLVQLYNDLIEANQAQRQFHDILFRHGFSYTERAGILQYQSIIHRSSNQTEEIKVKLANLLHQATQDNAIHNLTLTISRHNLNEQQLTDLVNYLINNQNDINRQNIENIGHAVSQQALPTFLDIDQLGNEHQHPLKQYLHQAPDEQLPIRLRMIVQLYNQQHSINEDLGNDNSQLFQFNQLISQVTHNDLDQLIRDKGHEIVYPLLDNPINAQALINKFNQSLKPAVDTWLDNYRELKHKDRRTDQLITDTVSDNNPTLTEINQHYATFCDPNRFDASRLKLNNEMDLTFTTRQELFKVNQQNGFIYKELHSQYSYTNDYSSLIDNRDQKDNFVNLLHDVWNIQKLPQLNQIFEQASQNSEIDIRVFRDSLLQDYQNNRHNIQAVIDLYQNLVDQAQDQNIVARLSNINSNLVQNRVNLNTRQTLLSTNDDGTFVYSNTIQLYQRLNNSSDGISSARKEKLSNLVTYCKNNELLSKLNDICRLFLLSGNIQSLDQLPVTPNETQLNNTYQENFNFHQKRLLRQFTNQDIINWLQSDDNPPITNDNRDAFYQRLQNAVQYNNQDVILQDAVFLQAIYKNRESLEPGNIQTLIERFNQSSSQQLTQWLSLIAGIQYDCPAYQALLLNYLSYNNRELPFETRELATKNAEECGGLLSFLSIVNDQPEQLDNLKAALNKPRNDFHFKTVLRAAMSIDQSLWSSLNELLKHNNYATNKFDQFMDNLTLWEDPQDEPEFDEQRYQYKLGLTQILSQYNRANPNIDRLQYLNRIVTSSKNLKLTPHLMSLTPLTDDQLQSIADSLDNISNPQATHQSQYFRRKTPLAKLQDILNNKDIHDNVGTQYLWWQQIAQAPIETDTQHPNRQMDQWVNNVRKPSKQNGSTANLMKLINNVYLSQSADEQQSELDTDQLLAVIQNQYELKNLVHIVDNVFYAYHSDNAQQKIDNIKPIIRHYINVDETTRQQLYEFFNNLNNLSQTDANQLLTKFEQENEARSSRSYSTESDSSRVSDPTNNFHTFFQTWQDMQKIAPDPTRSPGGHHLQGDINWQQFENSLEYILADQNESDEEAEHYKYCHIYHNDQAQAKYYKKDNTLEQTGEYHKDQVTDIVFTNSDKPEHKKDNERIELHIQGRGNNHIEKLAAQNTKPDTQYHVQDILRITEIAYSTGHDGIEVTGYNLQNEASIDLTDKLPEKLQKELNSRDKVAIKAPVFAYAMAQATKLSTFGFDRSQRQFVSDDDGKDDAVLKTIANKYYQHEMNTTKIEDFVQNKLQPVVTSLINQANQIKEECQKYTPDDDDDKLSKTSSMSC